MSEVTLTAADNGKSIRVAPGEKLTLRLKENPSTGFRWTVDMSNNEYLTLRSSDYIPDSGGVPGGGGKRVFIFEAKRIGNFRLSLKLGREWERDKRPASRFDVSIHVSS